MKTQMTQTTLKKYLQKWKVTPFLIINLSEHLSYVTLKKIVSKDYEEWLKSHNQQQETSINNEMD